MTMRTTDPPRSSSKVTGATNLQLYLVALLASTYVAAWWVFGASAPAASTSTPEPPAARALEIERQPRVAAWFHDLPPALRPPVDLPAGWHIAIRATQPPRVTRRDTPVPVQVPPARAGRIRTRSS
jgi:hypothetical protein